MIHKHQTFENFVIGSCNRFAFAAAEVAADRPGSAYNPLVVYSFKNVHGVGKTHLLNAIANRLQDKGLTVALLTADDLTEKLLDALVHHGSVIPARESLLEMDAIVLDDLQWGVYRETVMSEIVKLTDYMVEHGKQVVFGSDIPVDELPPSHLVSTLRQGLQVDLQPLDEATARAFLLAEADRRGVQLTETQIRDILDKNTGDARFLMGKLIRIQLRDELGGQLAIDEILP